MSSIIVIFSAEDLVSNINSNKFIIYTEEGSNKYINIIQDSYITATQEDSGIIIQI